MLDVGCGLGTYYEFLKASGVRTRYTGYDLVPEFIAANRERFPEARFLVRDILEDGFDCAAVDFVSMSQVFNNRYLYSDNLEVAHEVMRRAFAICRAGLSVDFLTTYVDYREDYLHYFSPEEMYRFSKSIAPSVVLRSDYLPFEFTMYLYRSHRRHASPAVDR